MGAAMDGTMVHIRGVNWKELKVGCVFDVAMRRQFDPHSREEVELGSAIHNSYVAHLGGSELFGRQLWAKARQRYWMHAEDNLTIGDGAAWIWNLVNELFYSSHQLVDWYHASEHLASAAKTLHGEGAPGCSALVSSLGNQTLSRSCRPISADVEKSSHRAALQGRSASQGD